MHIGIGYCTAIVLVVIVSVAIVVTGRSAKEGGDCLRYGIGEVAKGVQAATILYLQEKAYRM